MFDYLATELDELLVGHRCLCPIYVLVQDLRVFHHVLAATPHGDDVV